jgi:opacity protein-like surface antigen
MAQRILAVSFLLLATGSAVAADYPEAPVLDQPTVQESLAFSPGFSIGPVIGTTGIGLELGARFSESFGARGQISYFGGFDIERSIEGIAYEAGPNWTNGGLLLDYYPFQAGPFRLTAGARVGEPSAYAEAYARQSVTVGGDTYTGSARLKADLAYDLVVMPYLGIGAEGSPFDSNIVLGLDVGAFYAGEPSVKIRQTGGSANISQSDLNAEAKEIEDSLSEYGFFPVVQMSVKYRF